MQGGLRSRDLQVAVAGVTRPLKPFSRELVPSEQNSPVSLIRNKTHPLSLVSELSRSLAPRSLAPTKRKPADRLARSCSSVNSDLLSSLYFWIFRSPSSGGGSGFAWVGDLRRRLDPGDGELDRAGPQARPLGLPAPGGLA
ncbi:hypothetical protein NL676_024029 [Syzygium grande]|nr:hypothetical protein NL676_024029 [Syzygium grande]